MEGAVVVGGEGELYSGSTYICTSSLTGSLRSGSTRMRWLMCCRISRTFSLTSTSLLSRGRRFGQHSRHGGLELRIGGGGKAKQNRIELSHLSSDGGGGRKVKGGWGV